jgi:N-acetylneuraminic acid mutarotase
MNVRLFLFCLLAFTSFGQDYWELRDSIKGAPRAGMATFVLGNRGYAVGGIKADGSTRKMYSYSKPQNDWDDEVALGGITGGGLERNLACGFSLNGKGYVCLGEGLGSNFMNDLWEFDKTNQTWTQKADFIGTPRRGATSFVINNLVYVGTGEDGQGLCSDFYTYSPIENSWEAIANFPGDARRQAVGFELNGYGWVATGDAGTLKNDLWSYNVVTNQWQQKSNMPGNPRLGAVAWSTSPSAYIATGQDPTGAYLNDVWQYNYYQNSWTQRNIFIGGGRVNAIAMVINGSIYVGGGYNGAYLDDFFIYNGIAELQEDEISLTLYPNPSESWIKVGGITKPASFIIYSATGMVMLRGEASSVESLSIENLPIGTYVIKLTTQNTTICRSFIKR